MIDKKKEMEYVCSDSVISRRVNLTISCFRLTCLILLDSA